METIKSYVELAILLDNKYIGLGLKRQIFLNYIESLEDYVKLEINDLIFYRHISDKSKIVFKLSKFSNIDKFALLSYSDLYTEIDSISFTVEKDDNGNALFI